MRIKEKKEKPEIGLKWGYAFGDKPQRYKVPKGAIKTSALIEGVSPCKGIACADCGKQILVKDALPSPLISDRNKTYFRYLVCAECHEKEKREHHRILESLAEKG